MRHDLYDTPIDDNASFDMTQHFIVIGNPIAHSKSPSIHHAFAQQAGLAIRYARQYCPDDAESFRAVVDAFFNGGGIGANVTVPFKQIAYEYCLEDGALSDHARVAGAVNTLAQRDGKLYGDNTDGQGLVNDMQHQGWILKDKTVAIIGAGGAARGTILPLIQAGIKSLTLANRTVSKAETLVKALGEQSATVAHCPIDTCATDALTGHFDIIINATSIGLSGERLPLSEHLTCAHAYDMMYGRELPFLTHFADSGAKTSDGYGMLIGQAALSFALWTGADIDVTAARAQLT
ncbi:shikimate dehydrogenase [Psychrobacter aestuarii]|uniref:Shikimate dehydrogenase (NADP(+)) n=2 Tax=Psychrobacter aestuarii TaxID=556327 RepID=A0ABP3FQ20_9GAMM